MIHWKDDIHHAAFDAVQKALTNPLVLIIPNLTKDYTLKLFRMLLYLGLEQDGRPVAFHSEKFALAECKYTTGEHELLGVVNALRVWRCYLEGCQGSVTVVTDHNPLT